MRRPRRWRCGICGDLHDEAPLGYGAAEPELAGEIVDDTEKDSRVVNDGETCVIDDKIFFIKGSIEAVWHD